MTDVQQSIDQYYSGWCSLHFPPRGEDWDKSRADYRLDKKLAKWNKETIPFLST